MDTIMVRNVIATDHEQWLSLWEGYSAFHRRSGPTTLQHAQQDRALAYRARAVASRLH